MNIVQAAADLLWSPVLRKFPDLRVALSEGGIGWIPYFLERVDWIYKRHHPWTGQDFGDRLPSEVFRERIVTCFIDDPSGLESRHRVGIDTICWEGDYPHSDSTWPTSPEILAKSLDAARRPPTTRSTRSPTATPCATSASTRSRTARARRAPSARCAPGRPTSTSRRAAAASEGEDDEGHRPRGLREK